MEPESHDPALPKIYIFISARYPNGVVGGAAINDQGFIPAQHASTSEEWFKHDMGLSSMHGDSTWKHEQYARLYPDGYELVYVPENEESEALDNALKQNREWADFKRGGNQDDI